MLREGAAVVDLRAYDDGRVEARRSTWSVGEGGPRRVDEETVSARFGCAPGAGQVRYHQGPTGLDVTVTCEGQTDGEPPARALVDPDAAEGPATP